VELECAGERGGPNEFVLEPSLNADCRRAPDGGAKWEEGAFDALKLE